VARVTTLLSVLLGIGLSAACGFRIFVPFLLAGIAARTGHLALGPSFSWMAGTPALIVFGVATVLEVAAYYVPWLDHMLDLIATPSAVVAGMVMTASVVTGLDPMMKWTLALIAGGGIAGTVQALTVGTRKISLLTTGGLANPAVATVELAGAVGLTVLAIALPLAAFAVIAWALFFGVRHLIRLLSGTGKAAA